MKTQDGGIAAVSYAPSQVNTMIQQNQISVHLKTNYPFDDTLVFLVQAQRSFPFYLRIPAWASKATIQIGSGKPYAVQSNQFEKVSLPSGITQITLKLPMSFTISRGLVNNYASVTRGITPDTEMLTY